MPAQDLLLLLGQPPRVAHYAAEFVGWQLMGLPFIPAWLTMMTFLRPQPWMLQSPHGGHQSYYCIEVCSCIHHTCLRSLYCRKNHPKCARGWLPGTLAPPSIVIASTGSQGLVRLPMYVSILNGALGLLLCFVLTRSSARPVQGPAPS